MTTQSNAIDEEILDFSQVGVRPPSLDRYQQAVLDAIDRGEENICVVAGPATGKSRLIHAVPLHLLKKGFAPQDILVDAFQNIAKDTLNERFEGTGLRASTIHGHVMRDSREAREEFLRNAGELDFPILTRSRQPDEKQYEWGIADETQDHSKELHENFLSWSKRHLGVLDPWQSLFVWAGASPRWMSKFQAELCESAKPYELKINYRSAKRIVEVGNTFARRDITPNRADEGVVEILGPGQLPPDPDHLTILVRTNKMVTELLSPELRRRNIPHTTIVSKADEKKDIWNYKDGKAWRVDKLSEYLDTIVCTFHQAKGGEWPRVFVYYTLPPVPALRIDEKAERCIFYVGITRAMDELYVASTFQPYLNLMEGGTW